MKLLKYRTDPRQKTKILCQAFLAKRASKGYMDYVKKEMKLSPIHTMRLGSWDGPPFSVSYTEVGRFQSALIDVQQEVKQHLMKTVVWEYSGR
jgi:hypothetical protein